MKYRAVAVGVIEYGRSVQTFSVHYDGLLTWARTIARKYKCAVEIYEYQETLVGTIQPVEEKVV